MSLATVIAVEVPVTRKHLDEGIPGRCWDCALALAITDAVEGAAKARVYYTSRDWEPAAVRADVTLASGSTLALALGPDVARIMARIDAGQPVGPFGFVAEVLDEIAEKEVA